MTAAAKVRGRRARGREQVPGTAYRPGEMPLVAGHVPAPAMEQGKRNDHFEVLLVGKDGATRPRRDTEWNPLEQPSSRHGTTVLWRN